jgi:hypothetical protein
MFRDEVLQILLSDCAGPNSPLDASRNRFARSQVAMLWRPFTLFEARGVNFAIVV